MTEKREKRKQEIIQTAFRVWGRSSFQKTSLAALAKELGVSKTALYRYFSGKQELVQAMEDYFIRLYHRLSDEVVERRRGKSTESAIDAYSDHFIRFFAEHPEFFRFAQIHFMRKPSTGDSFLPAVFGRTQELFPTGQLARDFSWERSEIPVVLRYMFSVDSFLLINSSCNVNGGVIGPADDVDALLENSKKLALHGFFGALQGREPKYAEIEARCIVDESVYPETDRIISAVNEVVADVGFWNATVERIAGRLGMSKSSLYFYFENRDQMLWKMIDRERHSLGSLIEQHVYSYEHFEDQIYAYFVLFFRYLYGRPEFLASMNWIRFQIFEFQPPVDPISGVRPYYRFLDKAAADGLFLTNAFSSDFLVKFLNFLLVQEITEYYRQGYSGDEQTRMLRTLCRLFLHGMKGDKDD